jgi:acyl dehydratase
MFYLHGRKNEETQEQWDSWSLRMHRLYFEDFVVGRHITTVGITLTKDSIILFAFLYDPQPFHLDIEAAKTTPFQGLIASGFQTLVMSFRLLTQTGAICDCSLGGAGIDELRWHLPGRPGDIIHVETQVIEQRASVAKPDRGQVRMSYRTFNQRGELVQSFIGNHLIAKRNASPATQKNRTKRRWFESTAS